MLNLALKILGIALQTDYPITFWEIPVFEKDLEEVNKSHWINPAPIKSQASYPESLITTGFTNAVG